MALQLRRHSASPILEPSSEWWESKAVFNPGVTFFNGKIILLYRAMGDDNISRLGYGESSDGVHFSRSRVPVYEPPIDDQYERLGAEDARITKIGNQYFILYTAASVYSATNPLPKEAEKFSISRRAPFRVRVGVATTTDFKTIAHRGHLLGNVDTKDATVFPEKFGDNFYIIHRLDPNMVLATSPDCLRCTNDLVIARPRPGKWDSQKIGAGSQPIKTPYGWLLFYHGIDDSNIYHLGVMVLDLGEPQTVLYRSDRPILSPEQPYERTGNINNVVFTCGAIEWNDHYYIYYGGGDRVIGLATIPVEEVIEEIKRGRA